ncbi:hypothetical protein [Zavarzinella formosa]|uniref:hypothetical protein n=1 Tax=Zavarzinella formosa TaxID=360055 RepID=UPI0012FA34BD|nr:hypothetical protein [Zavarzinella formosa]
MAGFALQNPPQTQTAGFGIGIGTEIGLTLLEQLLRSQLASRVEQTVLRKIDASQVCPDDAFRELTKQLKSVNDRLSRDSSSKPDNSSSKANAELDTLRNETVQALKDANTALNAMKAKLEQAEQVIEALKKTPKN